jgi:hypothetical protein
LAGRATLSAGCDFFFLYHTPLSSWALPGKLSKYYLGL